MKAVKHWANILCRTFNALDKTSFRLSMVIIFSNYFWNHQTIVPAFKPERQSGNCWVGLDHQNPTSCTGCNVVLCNLVAIEHHDFDRVFVIAIDLCDMHFDSCKLCLRSWLSRSNFWSFVMIIIVIKLSIVHCNHYCNQPFYRSCISHAIELLIKFVHSRAIELLIADSCDIITINLIVHEHHCNQTWSFMHFLCYWTSCLLTWTLSWSSILIICLYNIVTIELIHRSFKQHCRNQTHWTFSSASCNLLEELGQWRHHSEDVLRCLKYTVMRGYYNSDQIYFEEMV